MINIRRSLGKTIWEVVDSIERREKQAYIPWRRWLFTEYQTCFLGKKRKKDLLYSKHGAY